MGFGNVQDWHSPAGHKGAQDAHIMLLDVLHPESVQAPSNFLGIVTDGDCLEHDRFVAFDKPDQPNCDFGQASEDEEEDASEPTPLKHH